MALAIEHALLLYVGTRPAAGGLIHALALDGGTGELAERADPVRAEKPSYLAVHPSGRYLYAVNEIGRSAGEDGRIAAYAIGDAGIAHLDDVPSGGAAPCFLSVAPDGRHLFAANYWGGTATAFRLEPDGRIGRTTASLRHGGGSQDPERDPGAHPHWIAVDRSGTACIVVDLGLDRVFFYPFDGESGSIGQRPSATIALPHDFGPRHCAEDKTGRLYVIGEFGSAIATIDRETPGETAHSVELASTLPVGFHGENAAAEIALGPDERFLYAANRGADSISWFARDPKSGKLTPAGSVPSGGRSPRHFAIDPSGRFLVVANQLSDCVTAFELDPKTGAPRPTGHGFAVTAPTCIRFVPGQAGP